MEQEGGNMVGNKSGVDVCVREREREKREEGESVSTVGCLFLTLSQPNKSKTNI